MHPGDNPVNLKVSAMVAKFILVRAVAKSLASYLNDGPPATVPRLSPHHQNSPLDNSAPAALQCVCQGVAVAEIRDQPDSAETGTYERHQSKVEKRLPCRFCLRRR